MDSPGVRDDGTQRPPRLDGRQRAMLAVLALSSFIVVLDAASLPIPLPSILRDLRGTLDEITWVFAAFILAFAIFLLPSARLADIYGRRLLFMSGGMVFALASLAAALAPPMVFLIGALAAQGIGAAMLETAARALVPASFPPEKRRLVFGVQRGGFFAGAAFGPILSGFITTVLSWQYIFWLNVLVSVVVVAGAGLHITESRAERVSRRLDLLGLLLSGSGLFFLVFPIIEGTRLGWNSPEIVGSFAISIALLAAFVVAERQAQDPLVDLSLFKDRLFAMGNYLRGATEFASLGMFFALSHFLQVQLGYSALVTGLLLTTIIVGALLTSPFAETLSGRVDVRWLVIPGFLLVAVGTFWVAHVSPGAGWEFFIAPLAIAGAGFGALESPIIDASQRDVPATQSEAAWRVSYTIYLLGVALGVAVVSGVWQSRLTANAEDALARANLPPAVVDRISASLLGGGVGSPPVAQTGASAAQIQGLVQGAFADAVDAALLSCVAVVVSGAAVALFFSPGRKEEAPAEKSGIDRPARGPGSD